ncbi:MAG: DNA polymerase III subunit delta [Acidobacteria bacterium]|nr:DNA polymerase III subunit delta [Acidobacteriota bacterium]
MPALDLAALKQQLQLARLAPVYLFVGEDVKLVDRMVDAVEAVIDPADRPFAVEHLYAGEPGGAPADVAAAARSLPMLGARRIVIVRRAERLLKPKRAARAPLSDDDSEEGGDEVVDVQALEDYLASPSPSTTLVFVALDVDRTRRFTKKLLEQAAVVEFRGLAADGAAARREGRRTAAEWLQDELKRAGRPIEPDAARLLADRAANDISKLRGDVERLLLFTQGRARITSDDVMEVSAEEHAVDDEWAVVNAIAEGNAARALDEVGRRMDRGDSPHALVGQLRWWVSSRLAEGDPSRVRGALEALLRADLALKSSGGDDRVLMERLVVELTGRPLPQRGWSGRR